MADRDAIFVDTGYVYALINTRDSGTPERINGEHALAQQQRPLVTSHFVLIEIADGLSSIGFRGHAVAVLDAFSASSLVDVVSASPQLYADSLDLYRERDDKEWGLTDCSSFVIMRQRGLREALTPDQHYVQSGFHALLLDEP